MHVEIFSLCDAATNDSGKLNILGSFDTIWAPSMPTVHPQCAVALRVRFEHDERGEHSLTLTFIDMDGKAVIRPMSGKINIDFPDEQRSGSANLVFNLQMLKIDKYGEYSIDLAVDGRREASLPLFVRELKQ